MQLRGTQGLATRLPMMPNAKLCGGEAVRTSDGLAVAVDTEE
jgi:hypothetical protein